MPRLTQWLAVTGCGEAGRRDQLGEVGEAVDVRVERLVGVQVDADAVLGGDLEVAPPSPRRVPPASRCGQPPTRSAPAPSASREQGPLVGAGRPGDRPPAQGDDLDVDHVGDPAAHLDERLDAAQPVVERRVGVGAHGA